MPDNIREHLDDFENDNTFLDITPNAMAHKKRMDKMNFIKIFKISVKDNVKKMRSHRLGKNFHKRHI